MSRKMISSTGFPVPPLKSIWNSRITSTALSVAGKVGVTLNLMRLDVRSPLLSASATHLHPEIAVSVKDDLLGCSARYSFRSDMLRASQSKWRNQVLPFQNKSAASRDVKLLQRRSHPLRGNRACDRSPRTVPTIRTELGT